MPARIYLARSGKPQKYALVDKRDYARLCAYQWHLTRDGYARRLTYDRGRCTVVFMHTEVAGAEADLTTDHKNRNRLDNRRRNLRNITANAQQWNQGPRKHNTTGFKGVFRARSRFKAVIRAYGEKHHLGTFDTAREAAQAYDAAALVLHGEYAYLNLPRRKRRSAK